MSRSHIVSGILSYRILGWRGGIKCVRKHVTQALLRSAHVKSRKIIELHFNWNLHSINTFTLFIHCTISIVYIIIMITSY